MKETVEDNQENYAISKDVDTRIGHKTADSSFFGYNTHLAMTEERIITAAVVTSEKGAGPELPKLLSEAQANGMEVVTIIGDAAYSGKNNLKLSDVNGNKVRIVAKMNPTITYGTRKEEEKFDYNKDADMFVCPAGHLAMYKQVQGKKVDKSNQLMTYYFNIEKCKVCPLRHGCYKPEAKSRTYSVAIKTGEHEEQEIFQQSKYFK